MGTKRGKTSAEMAGVPWTRRLCPPSPVWISHHRTVKGARLEPLMTTVASPMSPRERLSVRSALYSGTTSLANTRRGTSQSHHHLAPNPRYPRHFPDPIKLILSRHQIPPARRSMYTATSCTRRQQHPEIHDRCTIDTQLFVCHRSTRFEHA